MQYDNYALPPTTHLHSTPLVVFCALSVLCSLCVLGVDSRCDLLRFVVFLCLYVSSLQGLDGAIDLVWDNKRSSMVANDPFLSDEQTLALRHYIHDAMELPEISREGPDLYIELSGVSDILGGLEIFLPGLEKEMVETIQKTIEQVLSELVQRFPEAAPLVQVSAWRAVSPSSTN